jgi:hypothetical protein
MRKCTATSAWTFVVCCADTATGTATRSRRTATAKELGLRRL